MVTPLIKDFGLVKAIESVLEDLSAVNDMKIDFVSDEVLAALLRVWPFAGFWMAGGGIAG